MKLSFFKSMDKNGNLYRTEFRISNPWYKFLPLSSLILIYNQRGNLVRELAHKRVTDALVNPVEENIGKEGTLLLAIKDKGNPGVVYALCGDADYYSMPLESEAVIDCRLKLWGVALWKRWYLVRDGSNKGKPMDFEVREI